MARFTVMGFTEAELGFIVAGVFAAIVALKISAGNGVANEIRLATLRGDSLAQANKALTDSLKRTVDTLASLKKKSNLVAPCSERGRSDQPIAVLTAQGAQHFNFAGRLVSTSELRSLLKNEITQADSLQCRFTVELKTRSGLDAREYVAARRSLSTTFYIRDR